MSEWDGWCAYLVTNSDGLFDSALIFDLEQLKISSRIINPAEQQWSEEDLEKECTAIAAVLSRMSLRENGAVQTVRTVTDDNLNKIKFGGSSYNIFESEGVKAGDDKIEVPRRSMILKRCEGEGFCVCYQSNLKLFILNSYLQFGSLIAKTIPIISSLVSTGISQRIAASYVESAVKTLIDSRH
jgi:hypothetical protein